jgi:3-deoxy-D-manno-octulosonic-acid transferase
VRCRVKARIPLIYFLYRILSALSAAALAPYYAVRAWRRGVTAGTVAERLGRVPPEIRARASASAGRVIWIHAVSVGEVLAAGALVEGLKRRLPDCTIFVSTTTDTGRQLARERLASADGIFYFPWDSAGGVRRALRGVRPVVVIVMETEIWPNFLREARKSDIPVIFANARISQGSFARFTRWKFLVGELFARAMQDAELFLAQTPEDAARLVEMGADEERVSVTGNLKYDVEAPAMGDFSAWLAEQIRAQERWPVLVVGSVLELEEDAVLEAYDAVQRKFRRTLLVLAPRKPERFEEAAKIAMMGGWNVVRRGSVNLSAPLNESADVLVLDSIGELAGLYSLADVVFVGGSLVPAGGHNILEPAWFAKPPVFGPSMENFQAMAAQFLAARAAVEVASGLQLGKVWLQLIEDKALSERMGRAARELCQRNRGATERAIEAITHVLSEQGRWK